MARSTNGSSEYIDPGMLSVLDGATTVTLAGWGYRAGTGTTLSFGIYLAGERIAIQHLADDHVYAFVENGGTSYGHIVKAVSGWHHYALVYDGGGADNPTKVHLWFDGGVQILSFVGTIPTALANPLTTGFAFGLDSALFYAGAYAETGLWTTVLSSESMTELSNGFSPVLVERASLKHYWPLLGGLSPEPERIGRADGTLHGTSTFAHPPVMRYPVPTRTVVRHPSAARRFVMVP